MPSFSWKRSEVKDPIKPKPKRHITGGKEAHGWISPRGLFYSSHDASSGTHNELAKLIKGYDLLSGEDAESMLEEEGWLKVGYKGIIIYPEYKPVTQEQLNIVFDYYNEIGKKLPDWAKVENPKNKNPDEPSFLKLGDTFGLMDDLAIYIYDLKEHESKIHHHTLTVDAKEGELVRYDGPKGKSTYGRIIYQMTLLRESGNYPFDVFEGELRRIIENSELV